jgi:tetratricopeptide (TPR) repeat protein
LPDYALWKDVADPEQLVYKLQLCDSWDAGKDIVGQLQRLVGDSAERPERIPAKFIEAAGDWCRSKNQYPLALWFYDSALDRDPEIFTCKVEYYCLLAEFVPSKRANAIDSLRELALVARNQATLARIFNAFLELQRYAELVQVIDSVIAVDNFREQANIYAMLLRNRAVARRSINRGMITSDALEDIRMAMQLSSGDEDIQWTYAQFLFDDRRYEEAAHIYTKLIGMDPRDIRYYRYLALSYASIGRREAALKVIEVAKEFVSEDRDIVALTNALRQVQALTGSDEIEGVRIVQVSS